jgi:hypothetical protein
VPPSPPLLPDAPAGLLDKHEAEVQRCIASVIKPSTRVLLPSNACCAQSLRVGNILVFGRHHVQHNRVCRVKILRTPLVAATYDDFVNWTNAAAKAA